MVELFQTAKFDNPTACRSKAKSIRMLASALIQPWTKERALALAQAWEARARKLERALTHGMPDKQAR